jgi:hypothetical protein
MAIERSVNGYLVRSDFGDSEPRIHDLELAKRLGYERPRKIRELIERHLRDGNLNESGVRPTVGQTSAKGGRPATEYWLDQASALFVASQSGTEKAIAITKEVIAVFIAVRNGSLRTHPLLADEMAPWDSMFSDSLVEALCRLYGHRYVKGTHPRFLASVQQKLYRLICDAECYAEMKAANPSPRFGSNHHQLLVDKARDRFRAHLTIVEFTARVAVSRDDFWQRLEAAYANRPMQLPLGEVA